LGPDQGNLFESELFALDFGTGDPNLVVAGGSDFGVAGHEATVWVSANRGEDWDKNYEGPMNEDVQDIQVIPDGTNLRMLACYTDFSTDQTGGVLRSSNGGASWGPSSAGLNSAAQGWALALRAGDPNTVYLADGRTSGGAYVSTDGGQSWGATGAVGALRAIECDPLDPMILYGMRSSAPRIQISCDGGASFDAFATGLSSAGVSHATAASTTPYGSRLFFASGSGTFAARGCGVSCRGDTNGDGRIDNVDLQAVLNAWAEASGDPDYSPAADLNGDGIIGNADLQVLLESWASECP
jgi:hypothetical protein